MLKGITENGEMKNVRLNDDGALKVAHLFKWRKNYVKRNY
nr:MAG TPA: hypothetical protein [Caudoviricetes sp.]